MTAAPDTIAAAVSHAARQLHAAHVRAPRCEARLLAAHALGIDVATTLGFGERSLTQVQKRDFLRAVRRRVRREPMAHIVGRREFWSLDFEVGRDVLTPRPESETLIEVVLNRCPDRSRALRVLDLGTGSGCLLLALLTELPAATGIGVDRCADAVSVARRNAHVLGLGSRAAFVVDDWAQALCVDVNVVIANPPYVRSDVMRTLAPEVRDHEPRCALDGGVDGADAYRALAPQLPRLLRHDGFAVVEVGADQASQVERLFACRGMRTVETARDLAARDRCLVLELAPAKVE